MAIKQRSFPFDKQDQAFHDRIEKWMENLDFHPLLQSDIFHVIVYGAQHGYGNMIAWLMTAWAQLLIKEGASKKMAIECVLSCFPNPNLLSEEEEIK